MSNKRLEALAALATADETSSVKSGSEEAKSKEKKNESRAKESTKKETNAGSPVVTPKQQQNHQQQHKSQTQTNGRVGSSLPSMNDELIAATQQWEPQATATNGGFQRHSNLPNMSWLTGSQQLSQTDSTMLALQQGAYYQQMVQALLAQSGAANVAALTSQLSSAPSPVNASFNIQSILDSVNQNRRVPNLAHGILQTRDDGTTLGTGHVNQRLPGGVTSETNISGASSNSSLSSMPPPQTPGATSSHGGSSTSMNKLSTNKVQQVIAPQPTQTGDGGSQLERSSFATQFVDKKQQKRAANRRSAQLSRKRKKQFIEELKEENDDLRRKEQILKSIPDLVVVFDSSGKLWFVSQSVSRFLSFSASELEGTSFWERLCDDSVRLLKAAFMDSLAARTAESESAPLGSGIWELRLVDKDGSQRLVMLNGVVHFAGERPECVCSIRPREEETSLCKTSRPSEKMQKTSSATVSRGDSDTSKPQIRVAPHQSVVSSASEPSVNGEVPNNAKCRDIVRISDSGNSSVGSESGSGDEGNA